jgi:hypothetical protein
MRDEQISGAQFRPPSFLAESPLFSHRIIPPLP